MSRRLSDASVHSMQITSEPKTGSRLADHFKYILCVRSELQLSGEREQCSVSGEAKAKEYSTCNGVRIDCILNHSVVFQIAHLSYTTFIPIPNLVPPAAIPRHGVALIKHGCRLTRAPLFHMLRLHLLLSIHDFLVIVLDFGLNRHVLDIDAGELSGRHLVGEEDVQLGEREPGKSARS